MNSKFSKILGLGLFTSVISLGAFAEPPVQAGETLESLSKAKVSTTVNGQEASLENLVNSGQVRLVDPRTSAAPQQAAPQNDPSLRQAPNNPGSVAPQPPVMQPGINETQPANLTEPAGNPEQEANISMPDADPALVEQPLNAAPEAPAAVELEQ